MPTDQSTAPTAGTAKATTIVAVGMLGMNALAYAFTLAAAHRLGPKEFSAVSALLGILIVANVGALALQATAARRLATAPPADRSGGRGRRRAQCDAGRRRARVWSC